MRDIKLAFRSSLVRNELSLSSSPVLIVLATWTGMYVNVS